MKKHTKLAVEEIQNNQKLAIKKITLRDLDEPELDHVAGGEPTTTVLHTHVACTTGARIP